MLTGVAFCPQAPALVPEVGRGLESELGPVRAACRTAIGRVATPGTQLVLVGGGPANARFGPTSRGSFAGFGVDLVVPLGSADEGPVDLPPSLAVGAWLVRDALGPDVGAVGYAVAAERGELPSFDGPEPTALIVLGDGSARRTEKAPGYFDERAAEYDRRLATTLADGQGWRLNDPMADPRDPFPFPDVPDIELELLVAGHWARAAVASATEAYGQWDAELLYDDAPFGVGYVVATWQRRGD